MRFIWMIFAGLLVAMVAILPRWGRHAPDVATGPAPVQQSAYSSAGLAPLGRADLAQADSIVAFGLAQRGTPYVWAGTSPLTGFDCSGFILYTFAHFGVPVPHSTAMLINVGRPVARAEAQPGDIVVFSGTDKTSTAPGHAGIVISRRGELPLRFVHASSSRREPFVKVNQVENSDYERRFMQVRRVLGPGTGVAASARAKTPGAAPAATQPTTAPVAPILSRPVAVSEKDALSVPLPKVLPKRAVTHRLAVRKPKALHKPRTKVAASRRATDKAVAKKGAKATAAPRAAHSKLARAKQPVQTKRKKVLSR